MRLPYFIDPYLQPLIYKYSYYTYTLLIAPNTFIEYLTYLYLRLTIYPSHSTSIDVELAIITYSNCFYLI